MNFSFVFRITSYQCKHLHWNECVHSSHSLWDGSVNSAWPTKNGYHTVITSVGDYTTEIYGLNQTESVGVTNISFYPVTLLYKLCLSRLLLPSPFLILLSFQIQRQRNWLSLNEQMARQATTSHRPASWVYSSFVFYLASSRSPAHTLPPLPPSSSFSSLSGVYST